MKVVIALDDSPYSKHMLDLICRRKWHPDTEFKLVHVIEPFDDDSWAVDAWTNIKHDVVVRRHKMAEHMLTEARHKIMEHVPDAIVHFEVREGKPHREIVLAAADWDAHKVLVGAHGRDVCPHNALGSVSRHVAEQAPCVVEVVRPHQQAKTLSTAQR